MDNTNATDATTTADPRPFIRHMTLAAAWVCYNSRSGKASEKQTLKVMERQSADVLYRMLAERNALPNGCEPVRVELPKPRVQGFNRMFKTLGEALR